MKISVHMDKMQEMELVVARRISRVVGMVTKHTFDAYLKTVNSTTGYRFTSSREIPRIVHRHRSDGRNTMDSHISPTGTIPMCEATGGTRYIDTSGVQCPKRVNRRCRGYQYAVLRNASLLLRQLNLRMKLPFSILLRLEYIAHPERVEG
jgi:hypothetical protein